MECKSLEKNALRIKEITILAKEAMENGEVKDFLELLREFVSLKKKINIGMIEQPTIPIYDKDALSIIKCIKNDGDEKLEMDEIIIAFLKIIDAYIDIEQLCMLDENELEDLSNRHLTVWFSPQGYVEGLYEIGSLVVGIPIPPIFNKIVREAKSCYAFQQYMAVMSLCRSMLDCCVRHICNSKEVPSTGQQIINKKVTYIHRKKVTEGNKQLYNRLEKQYDKASKVIHGSLDGKITSGKAKEFFKSTLVIIQNLYDHNDMQ